MLIANLVHDFIDGLRDRPPEDDCVRERELREELSERQIDKMVKDSFPASDPPGTY